MTVLQRVTNSGRQAGWSEFKGKKVPKKQTNINKRKDKTKIG